jgi:hypothetical protein
MAIQLEANMADAAEFAARYDDPALAYRFGMLEACRLISELQQYYTETREQATPFHVLHESWSSVFDAVEYLRDVAYRQD